MSQYVTRLYPIPPAESFGISMPKGSKIIGCMVIESDGSQPHMTVLWDVTRKDDRELRQFLLEPHDDHFSVPEGKDLHHIASFFAFDKHFHLFEVVPELLRNFTLIPPSHN